MSSAVKYLNSLSKFGINPGLERVEVLLEYLGNPQEELDIIHIGGSNGKGSTSAMVSSILAEAGYRVGTYNSPEIISFYERMRINGEYMEPEALERITKEVKPYLNKIEADGLGHPTFFEVVTAIAFKYFAEKEVDIAVLEVGLGGRLDATNATNSLVAGITNISLEHTDYLGETMAEIAFEKGGIIKEDSILVTAVEDDEALNKLKDICEERNADMIQVKKDLKVKRLKRDLTGQHFRVEGKKIDENLKIPLLGQYQQQNLGMALGIIEALPNEFQINIKAIKRGLKKVEWPGRLELLGEEPLVILDGAHNPDGAYELRKVIQEDLDYKELILILSILGDKDVEKMLDILTPLADRIIITKNTNERVADPHEVAEILANSGKEVDVVPNIADAVQEAIKEADSADLISVSGSLYTIAEARKFLVKNIIN
ncbi:bifunctional folylpolyglutamate synthase/dihydrofolate synthase [Selenihalanaerobacter shriftii]|uniref:Dihydrofolate synthase/folylpolyglutamate synthase n=1 Tax=Selenihalanaerobacter shriftii TaxID=142842 RepID=A0A1T4MKF7_9FIRM|nr:folylpolyglutamate synthase/dihydrofolate synthase family protein [Selenihalanaerobacter shriftii]SJZ67482.1 dihydrofolate synthase / folylpolyglutamate synthase [Selenihalanaerobacter shriftii]